MSFRPQPARGWGLMGGLCGHFPSPLIKGYRFGIDAVFIQNFVLMAYETCVIASFY